MLRNYSSFIQNISVFTKDFKNYKTYFKSLISGKIIFSTIQISFMTLHNVCLGFCLVCWFTSLHDFFVWENVQIMSIISLLATHSYKYLSKHEVLKAAFLGGQCMVTQARVNLHETMGRAVKRQIFSFEFYDF